MEHNKNTINQSLCSGCCISYSYSKDLTEENIVDFLLEHGVLVSSVQCTKCKLTLSLNRKSLNFSCYGKISKSHLKTVRCRFRRSVWSHTFFHNCKISVSSVFRLVSAVLWLLPPRNKVILREIGDDSKNLFNWFLSLREVFVDAVSQNSQKLGGKGQLVELIDAKWKSDNLKGGVWDWALGGIDRQSGETFLAPVENYNFNSLKIMISEKINPGSIIITNCTNSFSEDEVKDLKKSLSVSFVHPAFSEISKVIKHHWSEVCKGFTSLSSKRPPHSVEQLAEYLFKSKHPVLTERMHAFFVAAADLWPPGVYNFVPLLKKRRTYNSS